MDLSFLFSANILYLCIFNSILTFVFLYFFIKSGAFRERIREELQHKITVSGTPTSGGFVFFGVFLANLSIYFKHFSLTLFQTILFAFLFFFRKHIAKIESLNKKTIFICVFGLLICIFVLLKYTNFAYDKFYILYLTIFCAVIFGFLDDLRKTVDGIGFSSRFAFISYGLIGAIPVLYNVLNNMTFLQIFAYKLPLGYFYPFFALFLFIGTLSGSNFTDGINGGLGLPTIGINAFFIAHFLRATFFSCNYVLPIYDNTTTLFAINCISILLPFLFFNLRGKIFMGDSGSLGIGALIASIALLNKTEVLLPIYGILFVIEVLSVILQTYFFKRHKRRIFLFSPIHHHFELLGWSGNRIITYMTGVTLIGSFVAFVIL